MLLWACIGWVFAATIVAMLPMRHQYIPGIALLIAAPVLIAWVGITVAWWAGCLALAAFVSMFRNPLRYFMAKARGQNPQLPPEFRS
ncbi:hypothetical protein GCM10007385_26510 [Tateyamaria omphalii]|uniref:DUF2484 family protein n=1 Tax=Tateyamaria omphalii TaxID=299262 RepID=UPI0016775C37|nr:DUF2484 family protein [Tateyamaria omphalii]GGX56480.1 hypothetical protein GCM10007385_26510 [Tateyamaria omphalii]